MFKNFHHDKIKYQDILWQVETVKTNDNGSKLTNTDTNTDATDSCWLKGESYNKYVLLIRAQRQVPNRMRPLDFRKSALREMQSQIIRKHIRGMARLPKSVTFVSHFM
jgi:hypothetical protein